MSDIALSVGDRKRLLAILAELFPTNRRADALLQFVNYPRAMRPIFDGKPLMGWQQTFADFDRAGPEDTPYAELLLGAAALDPLQTELIKLTISYQPAVNTALSSAPLPRVMAVTGGDPIDPDSWGGRELEAIRQAHRFGHIQLDVCAQDAFDLGRLVGFRPEVVHVTGHCKGEHIRFGDTLVPAAGLAGTINKCMTTSNERPELIIFGGQGGNEPIRDLFRAVANCVVTHDEHVDVELSVRFATKLYRLMPIAPSPPVAVAAAHLFVYDQVHPARDPNTGHLSWSPPVPPREPDQSRSSGLFNSPRPEVDIRMTGPELAAFEKVLTQRYRDLTSARHLMLIAGIPERLVRDWTDPSVDWRRAMYAILDGSVDGTPYRLLLQQAAADYPGDTGVLGPLRMTYLGAAPAPSRGES